MTGKGYGSKNVKVARGMGDAQESLLTLVLFLSSVVVRGSRRNHWTIRRSSSKQWVNRIAVMLCQLG